MNAVLPDAVSIQTKTGLPAAIMVAQCILETGFGQFVTVDRITGQFSFNLFNIKGIGSAGTVLSTTFEYFGSRYIEVDAYFRAYHSYEESFADYGVFILENKRYAPAVAAANNPVEYARQLQACGYATDPQYANSLINLTKNWNLIERVNEIFKEQEELAMTNSQIPSDWAVASIEKAKATGVMVGDGYDWNPHKPVTREMLAVILDRLGFLDMINTNADKEISKLYEEKLVDKKYKSNIAVRWGEIAELINKIR
nr:glucosaminidase domain-containing protein [Desulforamulus aquiferis]